MGECVDGISEALNVLTRMVFLKTKGFEDLVFEDTLFVHAILFVDKAVLEVILL